MTEKEKKMYSRELQLIEELEHLKAERLSAEESFSLPMSLLLSGFDEPPDVSGLEPSADWLEAGLPAD